MKLHVAVLAGLISFSSIFASVTTVALLDKGEAHEAMVFHADYLWVGQSRKNFSADYRILIFDRKDQKVGEIPLKHSVQYLYAYDEKTVIAVGTGHTPNLTMYTIARKQGDSFFNRTQIIPAEAWANRWLGTINGKEYFTDPGGNTSDPETTDHPFLAAQTLFRLEGVRPRYLSTRLRLPVGGLAIGKTLFVLQKESIGEEKSNLAVVDSVSGKATLAFGGSRKNLSAISRVPGTNFLAIAERGAGQVVVYDFAKQVTVAETSVGSEPRSLATFRRCIISGGFSDREVQVLRRKGDTYEVATKLKNPLPETEFRRLFQVAVDEKTGRVYGRSNFPCNPMMEACETEHNRVIAWDAIPASDCE